MPIYNELNYSCTVLYSPNSTVDLLLVQPRTMLDAEYPLQSKAKPLPVWFFYPVQMCVVLYKSHPRKGDVISRWFVNVQCNGPACEARNAIMGTTHSNCERTFFFFLRTAESQTQWVRKCYNPGPIAIGADNWGRDRELGKEYCWLELKR